MSVLIKHMAMPKGCIYANDKDQTEYCPLLNHDDVPFCQYIETEPEIAIGIDERPVYCPLFDVSESCQDTVSRAAAVDALDEIESEIANGYGYQYPKWRKYFCELPSAQPELNEWCHDCKEYDPEKGCCPRWGQVIKTALEDAKPEQRWIPCSERLPEVHESGNSFSGIYMQSVPVLVYGICEGEENAQFHVVTYCDDLDGNTYWSTELDAFTITGVIAWMPLPEPYKGEQE